MKKNVKIGLGLLLFICVLALFSSINKNMEGLKNKSNNLKKRPKCIKPSSIDGNCGPVRKNKKGLSYKECPGYCEDPTNCYDDECEKYGLIIKKEKDGYSYDAISGPIKLSDIDTVSKSNLSNWSKKKNKKHKKHKKHLPKFDPYNFNNRHDHENDGMNTHAYTDESESHEATNIYGNHNHKHNSHKHNSHKHNSHSHNSHSHYDTDEDCDDY